MKIVVFPKVSPQASSSRGVTCIHWQRQPIFSGTCVDFILADRDGRTVLTIEDDLVGGSPQEVMLEGEDLQVAIYVVHRSL